MPVFHSDWLKGTRCATTWTKFRCHESQMTQEKLMTAVGLSWEGIICMYLCRSYSEIITEAKAHNLD